MSYHQVEIELELAVHRTGSVRWVELGGVCPQGAPKLERHRRFQAVHIDAQDLLVRIPLPRPQRRRSHECVTVAYRFAVERFGEDFAKLEGFFRAQAAQVKESELFTEVGTSGDGSVAGGTALARATSLATSKVADGKARSFHEGLQQAWAEHPELWEQHEKERVA